MSEFLVVLDKPNGMKFKTVEVYLEDDNGVHRQVVRRGVPIGLDVDGYVADNFAQLWAIAEPLADDVWEGVFEKSQRGLYREIVRAGVGAARGQGATLSDVTDAMEGVLLGSGKAGGYSRIKTLASGATAAQRDGFFLLVGYLVLNDIVADD